MVERKKDLAQVTEILLKSGVQLFRRAFLNDSQYQKRVLEKSKESLDLSSISVRPSSLSAIIVSNEFFARMPEIFKGTSSRMKPTKEAFKNMRYGAMRAMNIALVAADLKEQTDPDKIKDNMRKSLGIGKKESAQFTAVFLEKMRPIVDEADFSDGDIGDLVNQIVEGSKEYADKTVKADEILKGMRLSVELYREVYPVAHKFLETK